jgi:hypothetical protein
MEAVRLDWGGVFSTYRNWDSFPISLPGGAEQAEPGPRGAEHLSQDLVRPMATANEAASVPHCSEENHSISCDVRHQAQILRE